MSVILGMCSRWYVSYWTSWFSLFNLRLCLTRLSDVLDPDEVWALARLAGSAEIRYCKGSRTSSQWRLARSCRVFRPAGFQVRQYKRAALPQGSQSIASQITKKSEHGNPAFDQAICSSRTKTNKKNALLLRRMTPCMYM